MPTLPPTFDAALLAFARELRRDGLLLGPGEIALGLEALALTDLADRDEVRLVLRTLFAKSPLEQRRFDRLFERFWRGRPGPAHGDDRPLGIEPKRPRGLSLTAWAEGDEEGDPLSTMSYSAAEALAREDFAGVSGDDIAPLTALVVRLARRLATRRGRRYRLAAAAAERADLRRTLRRSLATGGEPLELVFRRRRRERTRLVFVFDTSGSMMLYSRFLLQLAYVFVQQRRLGRCEVFAFATELYRLTDTLGLLGVDDAVRAAQRAMPGRSGGTRIGASLAALVDDYGGVLGPRTVVVIASDGWDTGDLDLLEAAMRHLKRRADRVIWLNPLAGHSGYEPTAGGMRTALPHIDTFAPAHNLESLRALDRILAGG